MTIKFFPLFWKVRGGGGKDERRKEGRKKKKKKENLNPKLKIISRKTTT